ncbi:hypothetical protein TcBrA4_0110430 [Trypanosoma cruzi]|nr:hypothetical protein TcBrA4_0110430 [Trypanosoma cruzi]
MPEVLGLAFRWFDRPHMRMPQWRHRLLGKRLARWSPPKLPSMTVRQGTQEAQTRVLEMDQALPPPLCHRRHGLLIPADHGRLRRIHFGNVASLRIWTVTVWDCPSVQNGPYGTE